MSANHAEQVAQHAFKGNQASLTQCATPPKHHLALANEKCWICKGDAAEHDSDHHSAWRTPCACSLAAHEVCLLNWVADLERPRRKDPTRKIQCPQCQTEIKVQRPKSLAIDLSNAIDYHRLRLVDPEFIFAVAALAFCWLHGCLSVWVICGPEHAIRLFYEGTAAQLLYPAVMPIVLVSARTVLGNNVLTLGLLVLLAILIGLPRPANCMNIWPPSPRTALFSLPVIYRAYSWAYNKVFGELNRKWLAATQPTFTQMEDRNGDDQNNLAVLYRLSNSIANDSIMNAPLDYDLLILPLLASCIGMLLRVTLLQAWANSDSVTTSGPGLLEEKWARSVIGGMLFTVFKDLFAVYIRYKRAQIHGQSKVLVYDKKVKKHLDTGCETNFDIDSIIGHLT